MDGSIGQESESYFGKSKKTKAPPVRSSFIAAVTAMSRFGHLLSSELRHRHDCLKALDDHLAQACTPLLTSDLPVLEEKRQLFFKTGDEYESEISRYCALTTKKSSRTKEPEVLQALRLAKRAYHKAAVEYCESLNDLQASKKQFFLEKVRSVSFLSDVRKKSLIGRGNDAHAGTIPRGQLYAL